MTGIGQTSVYSTVQILSTVDVDGILFEILLHVLPDHCLQYEIMIGREVLALGLAVHMTSDKLRFEKILVVNACDVINDSKIDFDSIDTDVPPENRTCLLNILKSFKK